MSKLSLALTASRASASKLRRWKEANRIAPPTAAAPGFPYPHRNCAELIERGIMPRRKPRRFMPEDFGCERV